MKYGERGERKSERRIRDRKKGEEEMHKIIDLKVRLKLRTFIIKWNSTELKSCIVLNIFIINRINFIPTQGCRGKR